MREKVKKSRKSVMKKLVVFSVVCILFLFIALSVAVNYLVNKEFVIQKLEESFPLKAEVGEVNISLFTPWQSLVIHDVRLSSKGGDSRAKGAEIRVEKVDFSMSLMNLLRKRIELSEITLHGAHITGTYYEDGKSSIQALFESPDKRNKGELEGEKKKIEKKAEKKTDESSGLNAFKNHDFVAALGGFYIRDSSVRFTIEKSNLEIECKNLNIALDALEIDPDNLSGTDQVKLKISSQVFLRSTEGREYAQLDLNGLAKARLFNHKTGQLEPDIRGDFKLGNTSEIKTDLPVINQMWGKLNALKKIGLNVEPLPKKATFGRSESLAAHYHLGKVTVLKPLSLWIDQWELAVLSDSWIQTETDQHKLFAELGASEKVSELFLRVLKGSLKVFPKKNRSDVEKELYGKFFKKERFLLRVNTNGAFTHPKVRLIDGVPDISKSVEKAGKRFLQQEAKGLLRGLLKK